MSFLLNSKGVQKSVESSQFYDSWIELVKLLATGKAPQDLKIQGSLSLAQLRLRSLPGNLTVKGDLDLRQCQRLSRIGKNLKVEGNLFIEGRLSITPQHQRKLVKTSAKTDFLAKLSKDGKIPLAYLPDNLEVKGDLVIRSAANLRSFPSKLVLGGSLLLHGCEKLEKLPDKLHVNEDLILISCPKLHKLPDDLKAKRLFLIGCGVESLPYKMDIKELIHLESCPNLTSLAPSLLCLETASLEQLTIINCPIENLPYYVNTSKVIKINRVPINLMKDSLLESNSIRITNCKNLEKIESLLAPNFSLSFRDCVKIQSFSDPSYSIAQLDLTNCESLQALPNKLSFFVTEEDKLTLTNCFKLLHLPDSMKFIGRLEVSGCSIKSLPKTMQNCRVSWRGHWITSDIIFAPETLTSDRILTESNAEIRRLMLERVGIERVLSKANASTIDSDKDAGGKRSLIQVRVRTNWSEQLVRYLRCSCPSTAREYLLPVPPNINSCKAAAAWLAGFNKVEDYQPILET